ncbi:Cholesterol 7-alpha-monooxygenase [Branchiostoma belcheri]|nr:Cholesterol 7-alpha-monooxygenase [Branchiostoma belcheri]
MMAVLLGVFLAVVLVIVLLQATTRRRRPGEPPLERGPLPYLGVALEFSQNPLGFITSRWKKYGDVFTVRLAGHYNHIRAGPALFHSRHQNSKNSKNSKVLDFRLFSSRIAHRAFGMPIVYGTSRDWVRADSDALYPSELQGQGLDKVTEVMMGNLQSAMLAATDVKVEWNRGELWAFVYRIMFSGKGTNTVINRGVVWRSGSVLGSGPRGPRTLFGRHKENTDETARLVHSMAPMKSSSYRTLFGRHKGNTDETARLVHSMEVFQKYDKRFPEIISNVPWWLMGQTRKRYEYLKSMVAPAELSQRGLSDFMRMRQEIYTDGELSADEKAAFNFATMWASLSNTVPAAFWTLYYLLKDPVAMGAVRAEVDQLLKETGQTLENVKEGGDMIHVTRQQLNDMKCSAINEALRMCSASIIIRVATEDAELALESGSTFRIRKGDRVGLYPGFLHMDPEVYDDPETFKYDRFLEDGQEKTAFYKNGRKLRQYLLPFGHGVSMCPGRFFALNEIKQFVTIVVCYFDMELLDMETPPMDQSRAGLGTLAPLKDCLFRYRLK